MVLTYNYDNSRPGKGSRSIIITSYTPFYLQLFLNTLQHNSLRTQPKPKPSCRGFKSTRLICYLFFFRFHIKITFVWYYSSSLLGGILWAGKSLNYIYPTSINIEALFCVCFPLYSFNSTSPFWGIFSFNWSQTPAFGRHFIMVIGQTT